MSRQPKIWLAAAIVLCMGIAAVFSAILIPAAKTSSTPEREYTHRYKLDNEDISVILSENWQCYNKAPYMFSNEKYGGLFLSFMAYDYYDKEELGVLTVSERADVIAMKLDLSDEQLKIQQDIDENNICRTYEAHGQSEPVYYRIYIKNLAEVQRTAVIIMCGNSDEMANSAAEHMEIADSVQNERIIIKEKQN